MTLIAASPVNGNGVAPIQQVLQRLEGVREADGGWSARCPVPGHGQGRGDRRPSLSISEDSSGQVALHCHAGCRTEDVVAALDLCLADLFPATARSDKFDIEATYDYRDESGRLLFQAVRLRPKDFLLRRPQPGGGWIWKMGNTRKVPFRLPELLAADPAQPVFVVEGEKDALSLAGLNLIATTNPTGAGKWRAEYSKVLTGRAVVILPDNDDPGRAHGQSVAQSLHGLARSIQVIELPGLPNAGDVSDWLTAGGTIEGLMALVKLAPQWTPSAPSAPTRLPGADLPEIIVSGCQMRDVTDKAMRALQGVNDPPRLFERNGALVRVRRDEKLHTFIEPMTESALRGEMERAANFRAINKKGLEVHTPPPLHVVKDVVALPEWGFPGLEAIVESPVLRPDGTVLDKPGYDKVTKLFYSPEPGLRVPEIPESPGPADVARAMTLLNELFCDFPFAQPASRANALGLLLTPILRPAIDGPVPMADIDAPEKGTGKTLLAEVISIIATGKAEMVGAPRKEEEWGKLLMSLLSDGCTFIILDNLKDEIRSMALERALTSTTFADRILGVTKTGRMPQRATWVATANNANIAGDLSRRCYWIRLDAKMARPWTGRSFRHPDLLNWTRENRGRLLASLLTVARGWFAAGRPVAPGRRLGKFESWCEVVGSVLGFAGVEAFLDNLDDMYDTLDEATTQWERFFRAWFEKHGAGIVTVGDLVLELISEPEDEPEEQSLRKSLPDELADSFAELGDRKKQAGFARRLGLALKRRKDVRYGTDGLHLKAMGNDVHKGAAQWVVTLPAEVAEVVGPEAKRNLENEIT